MKNQKNASIQALTDAQKELVAYMNNDLGSQQLLELASGAQAELLGIINLVYLSDRENVLVNNLSLLFFHLNQLAEIQKKIEEESV